jgi:hypothetical protein
MWSSLKRRKYEAPHYVIFSSILLLPPSYAQIFSSAPYFQTLSFYVLPLIWETKFLTHTKQQETVPEISCLPLVCLSWAQWLMECLRQSTRHDAFDDSSELQSDCHRSQVLKWGYLVCPLRRSHKNRPLLETWDSLWLLRTIIVTS